MNALKNKSLLHSRMKAIFKKHMPKTTRKCTRCQGSGQMPDDVKTGAAMKKLRLAARIPQWKFAEELGIRASYLSDLEKGKRAWSDKWITRYRAAVKKLTKKPTTK